jgi:hypothetical protein
MLDGEAGDAEPQWVEPLAAWLPDHCRHDRALAGGHATCAARVTDCGRWALKVIHGDKRHNTDVRYVPFCSPTDRVRAQINAFWDAVGSG